MTDDPKNKIMTPDGYKSRVLDVISSRQKKGYAARLSAPPGYKFSPTESTLFIETSQIGGNRVITGVNQIDDKYFRILWARGQMNIETTGLQKALDDHLAKVQIGVDGNENSLSRIGVFFMILGELIDKNVFGDGITTVDAFIEDAISFLYEKENLWDWITHWQDIARRGRPRIYKASAHFEKQKIRIPPKANQLTLFDYWDGKARTAEVEDLKGIKIEAVGLREIDHIEFKVIETVQKMLSVNGFTGNIQGENRQSDNFKGYIPAIEFTPAEFCEAYGVPKRKNKAGKMVFNRRERDSILEKLKTIGTKEFIFALERHTWKNGKENIERIHTPNAHLWMYNIHYRGLSKNENMALNEGRLAGGKKIYKIYLTNLCPIFIDQIDQYFIIKRSEYKALKGRSAKHEDLFFTWLGIEANNRRAAGIKKEWEIDISDRNELAYKLDMGAFLKARQKTRIKRAILKCYDLAKREGMIERYEIDHPGKTKIYDRLILNKQYFEETGWEIPK